MAGMVAPTRAFPALRAEPRENADDIVALGGVLTLAGVPLQRFLVGDLRWLGEHRMAWFTAFGDKAEDALVLDFDHLEVRPIGVCFIQDGAVVALLSQIEKSALEDPDDYRIAWQLWQDVRPLREGFMNAAFGSVATREGRQLWSREQRSRRVSL